jgi:nucleoside-diphosphate-sugar epimerase
VKVFISGATGYIGLAVAQAFRRAGYEVFGLCRSAEKARLLSREEVIAVRGDITRPDTFEEEAAACGVLVHAAADLAKGMVGPDKAAIEAFLGVGSKGARPKTVIYTSGVWVHGATGDRAADETTPLNPASAVTWRPGHEQMVLNASFARGIVVRPGCVYGKSGGLTSSWFEAASQKKDVPVIGDGKNRWATVHVDDLADAYVRLAESGLGGEIFNVTDRSRNSTAEMARAAARAAGHEGSLRLVPLSEATKTMGAFAEALALDQHVESWKIARRLGWNPTHGGFVDGARAYFEAWKAWQSA